ncbi:hypothetical protein D3C72_2072720 [compost metagenome]
MQHLRPAGAAAARFALVGQADACARCGVQQTLAKLRHKHLAGRQQRDAVLLRTEFSVCLRRWRFL